MTSLLQDVRYALRVLVTSRGFTALAVITLALGIGANTALFSVVNGVVLRPLPFRDADRLVTLGELKPSVSSHSLGASFLNFMDWSEQNQAFDDVAAYRGRPMTLVGRGDAERLVGIGATSSLLPLLGARAQLGRLLIPDDDTGGQGNVVVISHGLWQRLFGGDSAVIGQALVLDDVPRTIVGVLPRDFRFLKDADFFAPLDIPGNLKNMRGARFLRVLARLKPGVSLPQARMDLDRVATRLAREHADSNQGWGVALVSLQDQIVGGVRLGLFIMLGTVALVLLIACANVANLLLSRSVGRQKEMAIRMALGASRARVFRQLAMESLILSLLSAGLALVLAIWGLQGLRLLVPPDFPRIEEVGLDGGVLGFTLLIAVLTALLFGAAPACHAVRVNLQASMREGGRGGSHGHSRLRGLLVTAEVALSLVVLVGAGLLGRSLLRVLAVDPGMDTGSVLTFEVHLPPYKYPQEFQQADFFRDLLDRVSGLPGVRSAALTVVLPLSGDEMKNSFSVEGRPRDEAEWANLQVVSPGYFRTLGIPVLAGRELSSQDTKGAPPVAVINADMARKYWPHETAIGKRLLFGESGPVIVGVAQDVKQTGLTVPTGPEIYLPYEQQPNGAMTVVLRTGGDPMQVIPPVRALVRSLDKEQPIEHVQTMEDVRARSVAVPRSTALLMGVLSLLSLVLVAVGIYGVVSYSVSQRTREIGVRLALGAQRGEIFRMVVRQSLLPTGFGIIVGLGGALALTRSLASLLFEVRPTDPGTLAVVTILMLLTAVLASYVPARRATSVDPVVALRCE